MDLSEYAEGGMEGGTALSTLHYTEDGHGQGWRVMMWWNGDDDVVELFITCIYHYKGLTTYLVLSLLQASFCRWKKNS